MWMERFTRAGACGGPRLAGRSKSQLNVHKAWNTITTNRVSGPPVGEASARSAPTLRFGSVEWKGGDATRFARAGTAESVFDDSLIPYASGPSDYPSETREKEGWRYKEIRKRV